MGWRVGGTCTTSILSLFPGMGIATFSDHRHSRASRSELETPRL